MAEAGAAIRRRSRLADAGYDSLRLAARLPEAERPAIYREVVAAVLADLEDRYRTPQRLRHLATVLSAEAGDLLAQVVTTAHSLSAPDREAVVKAAADPRPAWTAEDAGREFETLTTRRQAVRLKPRSSALQLLAELFPRIVRLGGEAAGRDTVRALRDTLNLWP